mgnify:CR=1 FL=1
MGSYPAVGLADARRRTPRPVLAAAETAATFPPRRSAPPRSRRPPRPHEPSQLADEFIENCAKPPPQLAQTEQNIPNHVLPRLGTPAAEVRRADIVEL